MHQTLAPCLLALSLLSAVAACVDQGAVAPPAQTASDDNALASRVRAALAEAPEVDAPAITVSSYRGIVSLSGEVASDAQREAAVRSARQVPGVRSVQDSLSIR